MLWRCLKCDRPMVVVERFSYTTPTPFSPAPGHGCMKITRPHTVLSARFRVSGRSVSPLHPESFFLSSPKPCLVVVFPMALSPYGSALTWTFGTRLALRMVLSRLQAGLFEQS